MYEFHLDANSSIEPAELHVSLTVLVPSDDTSFPETVYSKGFTVREWDTTADASRQLRDVLVAAAELL